MMTMRLCGNKTKDKRDTTPARTADTGRNKENDKYKTTQKRNDEAKLHILQCLGSLYIDMDPAKWAAWQAEMDDATNTEQEIAFRRPGQPRVPFWSSASYRALGGVLDPAPEGAIAFPG